MTIKTIIKALSATATLCVTLQNNPTGARYLVALAGIGAVGYIVYWVGQGK